jgi:hypothetical protein
MSVIRFSRITLLRIAASITNSTELRDIFYSWKEKLERQVFNTEKNYEDEQEIDIYRFVNRLSIANQAAYIYQYPDEDKKITLLDIKDKSELRPYNYPELLKEFNYPELLKELKSLRYNLYTNSGRVFLGEEDMQRLDRLIEKVQSLIIEGYERKEIEEEVEA